MGTDRQNDHDIAFRANLLLTSWIPEQFSKATHIPRKQLTYNAYIHIFTSWAISSERLLQKLRIRIVP